MNPASIASLVASVAVASMTMAQAPDRLAGWAQSPAAPLRTEVRTQALDAGCAPSTALTSTSALLATEWYAGGTAYDPVRDALWVSDGVRIQVIRVADGAVLADFPAARLDGNAVVSGLTMFDGGRRLLQIETRPGYMAVSSYDATALPATPSLDASTLALRAGAIAGGIAHDPVEDLIVFSISAPRNGSWSTGLMCANNIDRVKIIGAVTRPPCGASFEFVGAVTGLAYSPTQRKLFSTNGRDTQSLDVVDLRTCQFRFVDCCPVGDAAEWRGLAVLPQWDRTDHGASCTAPRCASCPGMRASLGGGVPVIGNRDFAVELLGAEAGAQAVLVLSPGACTAGLGVPFLCGPVYPSLATPPLVVPAAIGGSGTCSGTARAALPIPPLPQLAGQDVCGQWLVLCAAGGDALALSQGLGFRFARN